MRYIVKLWHAKSYLWDKWWNYDILSCNYEMKNQNDPSHNYGIKSLNYDIPSQLWNEKSKLWPSHNYDIVSQNYDLLSHIHEINGEITTRHNWGEKSKLLQKS